MTRPVTIQLELTYSCNSACAFCYNRWAKTIAEKECLSTDRLKNFLDDAYKYGVFSINFNGGEPLCRDNFFELAEYSKSLGFDIHCNSNATLIDRYNVKKFASLFDAMCTSIHGIDSVSHDRLVGHAGAFVKAINGISLLQENNVYVAVNVTVSRQNKDNLAEILNFLHSKNIKTVLLTRVLTSDSNFALSDSGMIDAIATLKTFQEQTSAFSRVAFPQPFPLCHCSNLEIRQYIKKHNIPCTAGMLTARVTPYGDITPCPVFEKPILGNLHNELFSTIWDHFQEKNWHKDYPQGDKCRTCPTLSCCGGGCLSQTELGFLFSKSEVIK